MHIIRDIKEQVKKTAMRYFGNMTVAIVCCSKNELDNPFKSLLTLLCLCRFVVYLGLVQGKKV